MGHVLMNPDPISQMILNSQRDTISKKFPALDQGIRTPIVFWKYLTDAPERFFNKEIFDQITQIYADFFSKYPNELFTFLKEEYSELNNANRNLSEINLLPIHDIKLPNDDDINLINFCDYSILPNYLRLIEGVYRVVINPIVAFARLEGGKTTSLLTPGTIYRRWQILCNNYPDFSAPFIRTVRNGIAHGGVVYGNNDIIFTDKDSSESFLISQFIKEFDNLVDFCNAMILAYLLFYYRNFQILFDEGVYLPTSFLFDELRAELSAPKWEVRGCIESKTFDKKSQLNIYIRDSLLSKMRLRYYSSRTVRGANKLSSFFGKRYSRFFISYFSKYYTRGFISYDGEKIKQLEEAGVDEISTYVGAIEVPLIFHRNLIFNRFLYTLGSISNGIRIGIPYWVKKRGADRDGYVVIPRVGQIFKYPSGVTVKVSLVVSSEADDLDVIIRKNVKAIIKKSIRFGRRSAPISSVEKYLPITFVDLKIMSEDFRKRKLEGPGLIPELVCTIRQNRWKQKVQIVDIATGVPEVIGNIRIVWNNRSGYPRNK
jgi:hypothetical protein